MGPSVANARASSGSLATSVAGVAMSSAMGDRPTEPIPPTGGWGQPPSQGPPGCAPSSVPFARAFCRRSVLHRSADRNGPAGPMTAVTFCML
jgi:hypothetical protein